MPPAIMPPTKSCDAVMVVPVTVSEKTLPRMTSMMIGRENVKTTVSFSRKKVFNSTVARASPSWSGPGSADVGGHDFCPIRSR